MSGTWLLLLWRYSVVTAVTQIVQSILNSIFFLTDHNATLGLIFLFVYFTVNQRALLLYICLQALSLMMDGIRVAFWTKEVTSRYLGIVSTLGTYYLVMSVFGLLIKLLGLIFGIVLYRFFAELNSLLERDQYGTLVREENNLV